MSQELHPVISIRLFTDQKCFGPGLAALLHLVEEQHSLRAAAISMKMAYSKAWIIMNTAEESLGFKLLDRKVGGKSGGGAVLTDEGRALLAAYDSYCVKLRTYGDELFRREFSSFIDRPSRH